MKNIFRFTLVLAFGAAMLCGCDKRELLVDLPGDDADMLGYVSFSGSDLTVEFEGERINDSEQGAPETRADDPETDAPAVGVPAADDFNVEIFRVGSDTPEVITVGSKSGTRFKFSELKTGDVIALPLGSYYVCAFSGDKYEVEGDVFWEGEDDGQPTWGGLSETFTLEKQHTKEQPLKEAVNVHCVLQTVKVTVVLEEALASRLSGSAEVNVVLSDTNRYEPNHEKNHTATYTNSAPHNYGLGAFSVGTGEKLEDSTIDVESAVSYLALVDEDDNSMFVNVKGNFKVTPDESDESDEKTTPIDVTVTIASFEEQLKAGQWRKIWLYLDSEDEVTGRIVIGARIETWVYDEEVHVVADEVVAQVGERRIPDYAPEVFSIGSSDFAMNGKTEVSSFAADGSYTGSARVDIRSHTNEAISKFAVKLSSQNSKFADDLSEYNINNVWIDLASPSLNSWIGARMTVWGFPTDFSGTEGVSFDLSPFLKEVYNKFGGGDYTIAFDIESGKYYYRSQMTLAVVTDAGGGDVGGGEPSGDGDITFEWAGHNLNSEYTITEGMQCVIVVTARNGIESLFGSLDGAITEITDGFGVPRSFDLCDLNPDETMSEIYDLTGLPHGNEVKGKTSVTLDISKFLGLFPAGKSQFGFTVTDKAGKTAAAELKLYKEE